MDAPCPGRTFEESSSMVDFHTTLGGMVGIADEPIAALRAALRGSLLLPPASGAEVDAPDAPAVATVAEALCARVMVVDDETMVGDFMVELLAGWGIEVVLHRSPLQALAWLDDQSRPLDLLITDQTMPQLDGLQLAQRATALRPGLPVLLYTGNADGIDDAKAKRHGVWGVLRKPVDNEALHALMKSCLHQARGSTLPGS
jgi:CheY-like chemotaxis protein